MLLRMLEQVFGYNLNQTPHHKFDNNPASQLNSPHRSTGVQAELERSMGQRYLLDQEMLGIRDELLRLSSLVDQAVTRVYTAFIEHDQQIAQDVVNGDTTLDALHQQIENHVERTLALQQPTTRDLRTLLADLLIASELERMGDHAQGIARTLLRSDFNLEGDAPPHISRMKETARAMLRDAMDAYVRRDMDHARIVAEMDHDIDGNYRQLIEMVVAQMREGKLDAERGTHLIWIGHNLERIGDRVTNICERVIYVQEGHQAEAERLNPKGSTGQPPAEGE